MSGILIPVIPRVLRLDALQLSCGISADLECLSVSRITRERRVCRLSSLVVTIQGHPRLGQQRRGAYAPIEGRRGCKKRKRVSKSTQPRVALTNKLVSLRVWHLRRGLQKLS